MKITLLKCLMLFGALVGFNALQAQTVSGTVSDASGPLPGASVVVKGTTNGTQTDFDGNYTLNDVADDATLVFSYIGYSSQEVAVGGQATINVTLQEDAQALDEVVIVGYGTQVRKEITTAVTSVNVEDFNQGVVNQPTQLLQGKVAGLQVINKGGNVNSAPVIRLRGISTVGGNAEPLVVIDGTLGQSLDNVDPNDIQNITVLKDGSAAAIYGTRGSSGVLLVTTKKGRVNQPFSLNYNGQLSTASVANEIELMDRQTFLATGGADLGSDTNWRDEVTRAAFTQVHNVAVSGGNDKSSYRVAMNFRDAQNILENSGFEQFNARTSLTGTLLNDKLRITFNGSFTNRDSEFGFNEALRYAVVYNPTAPIFGDDAPFAFNSEQFGGYFETLGLFDSFNPVSIAQQNKNYGNRVTVNYGVDLKYSFTDELTATFNVGQQTIKVDNTEYYPTTSYFRGNAVSPFRKGLAKFLNQEDSNRTAEFYLDFNKNFSDKFNLKLTGGYSFQEFDFNENFLELGDFPPGVDFDFSNSIEVSQDLLEAGRIDASSARNDGDRIIAFFARANATIDNAIYVNASIRREGSSRFGENEQWGIFPAFSVGADLNKYLQLDNVNLLKARFGYGVTGSTPPDVGLSQTTFGVVNGANGLGSSASGLGERAPNPDLKWEEKRELNFGVEFAADRLSATFDIYNRDIVDFIEEVNVDAAVVGFPTQFQNAGELNTQGLELAVNYDVIKQSDFRYNTGIIFSTYKSVLESNPTGDRTGANLGAPGQNDTNVILIKEGEEIGQIWGPVFSGNVDDNGTPILVDINGDGELVTDQGNALADNADFQRLGNGLPDFTLGWTNQIKYKNWDMNAFFRGAFGHSLVNSFRAFYEPRIGSQSSYNFVNTKYARDDIRTAQFSSYYVEKADFLRLDNLTIGYTFDVSKMDFIKSARLSLTGQNLFTITGYSGTDPEPSLLDEGPTDNGGFVDPANRNLLAPGIDRRNNFFTSTNITLGLNVNF